jgi:DNA-binding MarR family transcriptional regulator
MALEDFLGKTPEIKIIDFLSGNLDINYTSSQISEYTNLQIEDIEKIIPELIYNGIIEEKESKDDIIYYQIKNSKITQGLIGAVFANSMFIAEKPD